jgi:hypothetical protein
VPPPEVKMYDVCPATNGGMNGSIIKLFGLKTDKKF